MVGYAFEATSTAPSDGTTHMGTLAIVNALLKLIQGESHPLYRAALRRQAPYSLNMNAIGGCLLFLIVFAAPALICLEGQFGWRVRGAVDFAQTSLLLIVGGLLSLCWTVPLALLAGRSISHEREGRTWEMLVLTPYDTSDILLARAAASIRNVWTLVMGLVSFGVIMALFFGSPVIASMAVQINRSVVIGVLLMIVGMVAMVYERQQEIALAVVIGIVVSLRTDSQRMAELAGLAGGFLIRVLQLVVTFLCVPPEPLLSQQNILTLNVVAGSATLLAVIPMLNALLFIGLIVGVREVLIRGLYRWAVRHAGGAS
jgi:hypothetical protein